RPRVARPVGRAGALLEPGPRGSRGGLRGVDRELPHADLPLRGHARGLRGRALRGRSGGGDAEERARGDLGGGGDAAPADRLRRGEGPDSGRGGPPPPPGPRAMLHRQLREDRDHGGPARGMSGLTVLFDLDGTLTDSRAGITKSIRHALERLGRAGPDDEGQATYISPTLTAAYTHQ